MKKQPKVTEATKQAFIDAFCELCKTIPMDKITIQVLTREAGYNRCTFYAYFNNIHELLVHIENELLSSIEANIIETIKNIDATEKFIQTFVYWQNKQGKYIEVLLLNSYNSNFTKRLKSVMIPAFMDVYKIANNDIKSKYALEYHLSGIIGLMTSWIVNGRDIPMQQIAGLVRGVLSEGVLKMLVNSNKSA